MIIIIVVIPGLFTNIFYIKSYIDKVLKNRNLVVFKLISLSFLILFEP